MTREPELQGERVNSKNITPMRKTTERVFSELNQSIANQIPFWPETISLSEIAINVGISQSAVIARMPGVQEAYLIFQDKTNYSRLKRDFSNMEIPGKKS
jgi:hypothetical protein